MARPTLARSQCTSLCYALEIKTLCPHLPALWGGGGQQRTDVHATSVVKLPCTRSTHPLPHHCIPDKRLHLRHCYSHDATCDRPVPFAKESQRWDQATEESKQVWDTCWSWTALALAMRREAMPCASTHLQHLLFREVLVLVVVSTLILLFSVICQRRDWRVGTIVPSIRSRHLLAALQMISVTIAHCYL